MKKIHSADRIKRSSIDLLPNYHFDYSQARPNRFAVKYKTGSRVVLLDPDVAEVFTTPESVNSVLRALLATMPSKNLG
jgi:hypothetical protein